MPRRLITPLLFALAAALVVTACTDDSGWDGPPGPQGTASSLPDEVADELDAAVADTMEEFGVPAAVVRVDVPGRGSWAVDRGTTEADSGRPLDDEIV